MVQGKPFMQSASPPSECSASETRNEMKTAGLRQKSAARAPPAHFAMPHAMSCFPCGLHASLTMAHSTADSARARRQRQMFSRPSSLDPFSLLSALAVIPLR